ncbi:GNAT family N-acetyltransferase [Micromonospora chersina]|uniref:GNAT family N-acetyltransferase n=1 Tax=Micromonospora chersina TaxID=47854 RepID=UPI00378FA32D
MARRPDRPRAVRRDHCAPAALPGRPARADPRPDRGLRAVRHEDGFGLRVGGHIGYGIRPSARRRGLTTWVLGRMLEEARGVGLHRLLVTCADGNVASARAPPPTRRALTSPAWRHGWCRST